jgi:pyruvate/2-oxoglutarate dehydrogenase complex dihydrolipoamide dehydrogenase (E3) component
VSADNFSSNFGFMYGFVREHWKQYANIFLSTEVTSMNVQEEGIQVGFKGKGVPEFDSFDKVLVSIGRTPNGKLIDCEKAGVNVDDWGFMLSNSGTPLPLKPT